MKKSTIEQMQQLAESRKGKCLSKRYVDSRTPLIWECEKGHQWKVPPRNVKRGQWCRKCENEKRAYSIRDMQDLAAISGGQCLSKKYVNSVTPLEFKCAEGHVWFARPTNILRGHWCPECAGSLKGTIERIKGLAESRGGRCLSREYINGITKLLWKCSKGHKWRATPKNIKAGAWCPTCVGNRKKTIEEMQKAAKLRGGKCLSKKYLGNAIPLQWECRNGHRWWTQPKQIASGRWCTECNREEWIRLRLKEMRGIASSRGGKCLSESYINMRTELEWECSKRHRWLATPASVKKGGWCPECRHKSD
jgi:hypothetical protein